MKFERYDDFYDDGPCVIVNDRYGGSYSGGEWVAYPLLAEPEGPSGQDHEATAFWDAYATAPTYPIGVGESPDRALSDLREKAEGRLDWKVCRRWWLEKDGDPEPYEAELAKDRALRPAQRRRRNRRRGLWLRTMRDGMWLSFGCAFFGPRWYLASLVACVAAQAVMAWRWGAEVDHG